MSKYRGKKVLVVGFGLSGVATAQYLSKQGAKVIVTDLKQRNELLESIESCNSSKIEFELGKHEPQTFLSVDMIVPSPGIDTRSKIFDEARAAQIPFISEVEIAAGNLDAPLIAITGTNGKTTTTTLIGEMLKAEGKKTFVGGNNGNPLLNYLIQGSQAEVVVGEISSFQLDITENLTPAVAVFTNIEEDHLDRYKTFENYVQSKKRLLDRCERNTFIVLNFDDPVVSKFAHEKPGGKILWFTKRDPLEIGGEFAENFWGAYYLKDKKQIVAKITGREEIYDVSKFKMLGDHNRENLMAAICAARNMGASPAAIQKVIHEFPGLSHRLEFVRKKEGVFIFNDSKCTNVMGLKRSLSSFQNSPIILVAGGKDKDSDFSSLSELVRKRCKMLILLGEAKEKMNRQLGDDTETYLVGTFEEGVLLSYQKSRRGDIILLSPGCASYDMFKNFEERGDYFKKLVHQL